MTSPIESKNLSVAWAEAFLKLMESGCSEIKPLIVSIDGIHEGVPEEKDQIRRVLDEALARHRTSCNTVANTIFPESLWNPARERALLYQRYLLHAWPRVKKCPANNRGTYFQRLIAFENGDAPINQLEHVITTWHKKITGIALSSSRYLIPGTTIPMADGWVFPVCIRFVLRRWVPMGLMDWR